MLDPTSRFFAVYDNPRSSANHRTNRLRSSSLLLRSRWSNKIHELSPYRGDDNLARRPSVLLRITLERLNTYAESLSMKRSAVQPDQSLSWKS